MRAGRKLYSAISFSKSSLIYSLYKLFAKLYCIFRKIKTLLCFCLYGRTRNFLLLCTPTHGNLGDQAIALAEMDFLRKENLSFFEVTAEDLDGLSAIYSQFSSKKQKILIHGGGFLGSIWPKEELRFRMIIRNFSQKRIIVLPQTITFDMNTETGRSFFYESYTVYKSNQNIVFFISDENSFKFATEYMPDLKIYYVPDIVLSYKWNMKKDFERKNILFLKRADIEKKLSNHEEEKIKKSIKSAYGDSDLLYSDTCLDFAIFPFLRKNTVCKKLEEISKCELVFTDRLHGMIFAFITKTPCLAVDNINGKVKATYEWIKECGSVIFVEKLSDLNAALHTIKTDGYKNVVIDLDSKFNSLRKELHMDVEV